MRNRIFLLLSVVLSFSFLLLFPRMGLSQKEPAEVISVPSIIGLPSTLEPSPPYRTSTTLSSSSVTTSLINGLGGSADFGENVFGPNDDNSVGPIDITPVFPQGLNFFGTTYTSFYINNNGNITFNSPQYTYTPYAITSATANPIIAPYFADVDTRGGSVAATPGGTSTGSNLVYWDLDPVNGVFTVTWDDVGYFSYHTNWLNAFQLRLINRYDTGIGDFDIEFRYEDINWTTGDASGGSGGLGGIVARAGWSSGDGNPSHYHEIPESGNQESMLSLDTLPPRVYHVHGSPSCPDTPPITCTEEKPCDILDSNDVCPTTATAVRNDYDIEPETSTFCGGASINISHTRQGSYIITEDSTVDVCHTNCFDHCYENCVYVPVQECSQTCIRRCGNGLCLQWQTVCNVVSTSEVCNPSCYQECLNTYSEENRTSYYNKSCGFYIEDLVKIVSDTGEVVRTYNLTGAGTASANITLPLIPGNYGIYAGSVLIKSITIGNCGAACSLNIPQGTFKVHQGVDSFFDVSLSNVTAGGNYNVYLERWEDNEHTIAMSIPSFLSVPSAISVGENGNITFQVSAINPQLEVNQYHWSNVTVRVVQESGTTTCNALFNVDFCDADGDGHDSTVCGGDDCNDGDASVHPGAPEVCNGKDDNCNGQTDEGVKNTYYRDADGDGYGNPALTTQACSAPPGYVANNTDCNVNDDSIYPGAPEVCDGKINNCNNLSAPDGSGESWYGSACDGPDTDLCKEGTYNCSVGVQSCTDNTDNNVEICDGIDNDCNGQIDEGLPLNTYYRDADSDTYGNPNNSIQTCLSTPPPGYVVNNTDCNDASASVHPGVAEVCNGVDDNCNGQIDEGCATDLLVSSWTAPANACAGATISIKDTTKNQGTGTAGESQTCFYFSTNTTLDGGDTKLGCRGVSSISPGGISTGTTPVTLPNVSIGKYYLIAMADDGKVVTETNETNNKKTKAIYIGPDLYVSALSAPTIASRGSTISIKDTTKNKGCVESQDTATKFYLSINTTIDSGDTPLCSRSVPALGTGASNTGTCNGTIPSSISPGTYYIIANSDDGKAVTEANETNNKKTKKIIINP